MSKVKICGITNEEDAYYASHLGCDYLGLIFVKQSKRFVNYQTAKQIKKQVAPSTKLVGVFADQDLLSLNRLGDKLELDYVQLHGAENKEYIYSVERPVIKVLEYEPGQSDCNEIVNKSKEFKFCSHLLLDKPKSNSKSKVVPTNSASKKLLSEVITKLGFEFPRLMVAGGITTNSAKALMESSPPYAFDVCSSVEFSPRMKNPKLVKEIIQSVKGSN